MTFSKTGLALCARYAFAPNALHYCGPEEQSNLLGYLNTDHADTGLAEILNRFETLYPYLVLIAQENHLTDPFDPKVVQAYWLGNKLLDRVNPQSFADHLTVNIGLKKKLPKGKLTPMLDSIVTGVPHHSFHVLNIYLRTGHHAISHTLSTMDECRISWGRVVSVIEHAPNNPNLPNPPTELIIQSQSLEYSGDRLVLGNMHNRQINSVFVTPKVGDWVSVHWGVICDVISNNERLALTYYTNLAIKFANKGII